MKNPYSTTQVRLGPMAVRVILVGMMALFAFMVYSSFSKPVRLRFELWAEHSNPVDVYYALPSTGYNARLHIMQQGVAQQWWSYDFDIPTYRAVSEFRLDPLRARGEFRLRSLRLSDHRHDVTWGPEALQQHLLGTHEATLLDSSPDGLTFASQGRDPYLRFRMPDAFQATPHWRALLRPGTWLALQVMAVWGLLEGIVLLLRRHAPTWHARIRRGLTYGAITPVLVSAAFTWHAAGSVHNGPVLGDGIQNLLIAYNLVKHRTFSHIGASDPPPTDFREPLPPMVTALHLHLFVPQAKDQPFGQLRAGTLTRQVKLSNLYWVFAGLMGTWLLTGRLTGSHIVAPLVASVLAYALFYHAPPQLNTLYTELQTAALLTLTSWALLRGIQEKTWRSFAVAGVCLGLLALTKASFLPIGIVGLTMLLAVLMLSSRKLAVPPGRAFGWISLTGLAAVLTVMPWIARNLVQFDSPRISDRGGLILHGRAVLNNMTDDEVIGLIYENSPSFYRKLVQGTKYSASPGNPEYMRGGRWQRLNRGESNFLESDREAILKGLPEQAISFHAWAGANYTILLNELKAQGNPYPEEVVDKRRRREAVEMMAERPWRHLYMSFPFFWHGFWGLHKTNVPFIDFDTQDLIVEILNLLGGLALIGSMAVGLLGRRPGLFAATILPFGLMAFYAFISHNIPRYMSPAHPAMMTMLVVTVAALLQRIRKRSPR